MASLVVFEKSIPDRGNLVEPPYSVAQRSIASRCARGSGRIALLHFPEEAFLLKASLVTLRRVALTWIDNLRQRRCCEHEEHKVVILRMRRG